MGFWQSELGEITGNAEDAFTKSTAMGQVPDNTFAVSKIESFINVTKEGYQYLNVEWHLVEGEFKGSVVNQKIKCFDYDAKTKHRALNMLKLMYQLFKVQPRHGNPPTDEDLSVFVGKLAGIKIGQTKPNDKGYRYNWVSEIHSTQGFTCRTGVMTQPDVMGGSLESAFSRNPRQPDLELAGLGDDLPF